MITQSTVLVGLNSRIITEFPNLKLSQLPISGTFAVRTDANRIYNGLPFSRG